MTSTRKFVYAVVLAVSSLGFAPTLAKAQEPARGKFTLSHDVYWGNTKVPAGDYQFSFNTDGISPVLTLSKISGTPAAFMVLVPTTEETKPTDSSELVLETTPDGSYVTTMLLPAFSMKLHFNVPARGAEKQIARAATTAPALAP